MNLLTYSEVVLTVRSFQNRERWGPGGDGVNRGTDWPSFNKNCFHLHVNDLDTTEYGIFHPFCLEQKSIPLSSTFPDNV